MVILNRIFKSRKQILLPPISIVNFKFLSRVFNRAFVPVPSHWNWLQLDKDFDKLRNSLRSRVLLPTKNKTVTKISETTME